MLRKLRPETLKLIRKTFVLEEKNNNSSVEGIFTSCMIPEVSPRTFPMNYKENNGVMLRVAFWSLSGDTVTARRDTLEDLKGFEPRGPSWLASFNESTGVWKGPG